MTKPRGEARRSRQAWSQGGAQLRRLRERAGKTQLWVEGEAELGSGYLQRIECGRVAQPGRATLERILTALHADHGQQREVLDHFGYRITALPPTEAEIAWARVAGWREVQGIGFPAYVLDCTHRLVAWNAQVPRLFGMAEGDPRFERLCTDSLLAAWFDPASPLFRLVTEPDTFLPALIRALRSEIEPYGSERWCELMLARLWTDWPRFRSAWQQVKQEPAGISSGRALVPLRLSVPSAGLLQFRLSSEHLVDERFRIVYYFPDDAPTLRCCATWAGWDGLT